MSEHDHPHQSWLETFLHDQGAVAGTVHVVDPGHDDALVLRAAVNIPARVQEVTRVIPKGKGMAGLAYERQRPVTTCNLADDGSGDVRPGAKAVDARGAVALPILDQRGEVRAVVGLAYAEERQFDEPGLAAMAGSAADLLRLDDRPAASPDPQGGGTTRTSACSDKLFDDLRSAVAAELTTLPAYLYAYWTIKPARFGGSAAAERARTTIMSVILEEMLHMGQSSNILGALGGTPDFTSAPYLPVYPCRLLRSPHAQPLLPPPHADPPGWGVEVFLRRLSIGEGGSLTNFMQIELPEWADPGGATLGAFYNDIIEPELPRAPARWAGTQQFPAWDNPGAGRLFIVRSHADAVQGITEIVEQGEGTKQGDHDDGDHELAHFWKFKAVHDAIEQGRLDPAHDVYPVIDHPSAYVARYTPEQRRANLAFNITYSRLLDALSEALRSPSPDVFPASTGLMDAMGQQAAVLRQQGPVPGTQQLAGPTFEYVPSQQRTNAKGA